MNRRLKTLGWVLLGLFAAATGLLAQAPRADLALTFTADRTNPFNGANQWLKGGSIDLGTDAWHGFGAAARVAGLTISSIGTQGVPLSLLITTFGPRYRHTYAPASKHSLSLYGEALIGEANGFKSIFVATGGAIPSANTFALQIGVGVDYSLGRHFAYRVVEANWTRTQFQNTTTNVQNQMQLSSGVALRF
jgi:hypothetical protein